MTTAAPALQVAEQQIRERAHELAGVVIGEDKSAMIAARIQKRLSRLGLPDLQAYVAHLDRHPGEVPAFIHVITTHTTSFNREASHFPRILEQITAWADAGQTRFRLWCAAASTGEEPYTLAITLEPLVTTRNLDLRILATDIDGEVLSRAAVGLYGVEQVAALPPHLRAGFEPGPHGPRVRPAVRKLVSFARLNLAHPPYPMQGPLDVVLCRNVMIYLDVPTRQGFVDDTTRLLRHQGLLMVGHSESLTGLRTGLRMVVPSVYRKVSA